MCFIIINLAFKNFDNIVKKIVLRKIKYVVYLHNVIILIANITVIKI